MECRFGFNCTKPHCNFKHPKKGAVGGLGALAQGANFMNLLMMAAGAASFPPKSKFLPQIFHSLFIVKFANKKYVAAG